MTLVKQVVESALTEERALKICHVLVKHKDFLRDKNREINQSFTTQKLKHRLLIDYGSKICIANEINEGKVLYSSSIHISEVYEL